MHGRIWWQLTDFCSLHEKGVAAFVVEFPFLQVMLHQRALTMDVKHHMLKLGALDRNFSCIILKGALKI